MAQHLTKDQCKQVNIYPCIFTAPMITLSFQLFKEFDNGNGILSLAEVDRAILHWYPHFGTNRQAMMRAFKAADLNQVGLSECGVVSRIDRCLSFLQNGFVELAEFTRLVQLLFYYNQLSDLFAQLDQNRDRRISLTEFQKGHQLLGLAHVDDEQMKEEFQAIDTNNGGFILFDEVCALSLSFHSLFLRRLVLHLHGQEET